MAAMLALPPSSGAVPPVQPIGTGRPITGIWGSHHHNTYQNAVTVPTTNSCSTSYRPHVKSIFPSAKDDLYVKPNRTNIHNNQNNDGKGMDFDPLFYSTTSKSQNFFQPNNFPPADSGFSSPNVSPEAPYPIIWNTPTSTSPKEDENDDSDSDDDDTAALKCINGAAPCPYPNKFPVQIEYHDNKFCNYKRQVTRSGEKTAIRYVKTFNPVTGIPTTEVQKMKSYQKHLVRVCRCGRYDVMDGALQQGRSNDCNGYEIHYNQKCRWKAFDDMVTGKRVIIRLCKCYKPVKN